MTTWFISRHPGAIEWAKLQAFSVDRWVSHLDPEQIQPGDVVIGTLPVNLAETVHRRGAEFYFLSIQMQQGQRGKELDLDDMLVAGCALHRYRVVRED